VLLEWPSVTRRLEVVLPIQPSHTRALMREIRDVARGALVGTIATAVVQGFLAWIGYAIAGVPRPLTWATMTAITSFVPLLGTMVVWVPMGVYEAFEGHLVRGIFVLAWGALVVTSLSDYVIRPRIVGKDGGHPLLTLVALLGGLEVFGLVGLIVGPIIMSLFVAVLRIYERESARAKPAIE
jgi:predicted PurR-regulated permease PerM